MATYLTGKDVDDTKRFTFSAASLIQSETDLSNADKGKADTWRMIVDDLERALKAAEHVLNQLSEEQED
jgi:hypothetical protein